MQCLRAVPKIEKYHGKKEQLLFFFKKLGVKDMVSRFGSGFPEQ